MDTLQLTMHVPVVIIGSGPSGLLLAHALHCEGIESVILERQTREHVEGRIRAGILERITVEMMQRVGVAERMLREGLAHEGFKLAGAGEHSRIDLHGLTGGSSVLVYGQTELTKDLIDAAATRKIRIEWECANVALHGIDSTRPRVSYVRNGASHEITCDFIAGCDGYHGVSRTHMPADSTRIFERKYPFGWLGILADVPPCDEELIYCHHERGFALASMRSRTRSRYYVQCGLEERLEDWPDERIWDELAARLGPTVAPQITRGAAIEKSIAPLRSFVIEPMQSGRLYLAGDAAHIVPPTGAKGLNLAASDIHYLSTALIDHYRKGNDEGLARYSERALSRVWKAERFSWWFTHLTHRFPDADAFSRRIQVAELDYIRHSRAAQLTIAENYVGLPVS